MISLEGLTLDTGRTHEAAWIIGLFADSTSGMALFLTYFLKGQNQGLYHTADADPLVLPLRLEQYVQVTENRALLQSIYSRAPGRVIRSPRARDTFRDWRRPLRRTAAAKGTEGYQLTWMDAKVDGWVVTPRRGKAVEINALWYNALRLMEQWARRSGAGRLLPRRSGQRAEQARRLFQPAVLVC